MLREIKYNVSCICFNQVLKSVLKSIIKCVSAYYRELLITTSTSLQINVLYFCTLMVFRDRLLFHQLFELSLKFKYYMIYC